MLLSSRQQVVFDCCFGNSIGQGKGLKGREGKGRWWEGTGSNAGQWAFCSQGEKFRNWGKGREMGRRKEKIRVEPLLKITWPREGKEEKGT